MSDSEAATLPNAETKPNNTVSFEEFSKLDLRVAQVLHAEAIEKSAKLLKLRVALGEQERQVIAGLATHCTPQELVGRKVILVANLEPVTLMGETSEGMILAAADDLGSLSLLSVDPIIPSGTVVG